ncbi:ImmA/IrrE family metallo-endopeptidase [Nocardioides sp. NPDC047086]|uniref:ImmA/IrrE family metallo-endopeptidase n=1 Tax=Nocardioides sp. NPDC047086 TaxID=3154810 RepID=UPI0033C90F5D
MDTIGSRVLEKIEQVCPGDLRQDIAKDIGMTPDAFSRALGDKRHFSSIELARLADRLHADLHWLITGTPDPSRLTVAARHDFDHETGERGVPGREDDEKTIQNIALAYRQAYRGPGSADPLPYDVDGARLLLGDGFVRPFAERLEQHLGVDVVRLPDLSTAYSFTVGARRVIAVPATGNWFRENWSMAHELGHLAMRHHDDGLATDVSEHHEKAANTFAAELLLPKQVLDKFDWDQMDDVALAHAVWDLGVSTDALARRLSRINGYAPARVRSWADHPTQRLLRRHLRLDAPSDEITQRMDAAAQRRFPLALQEAHVAAIASGALGRGTLAWMLGIDPEALEVDFPEIPETEVDDLAYALGL